MRECTVATLCEEFSRRVAGNQEYSNTLYLLTLTGVMLQTAFSMGAGL